MATGTGAGLLDGSEPTQSFYKHAVLGRYLHAFTQKLSRGTTERLVLIDGYAGRGRYDDGTAGSAVYILEAAAAAPAGTTSVELIEADPKHHGPLGQVAQTYASKVDYRVWQGTVEQHLTPVLDRAKGHHAMFFLDPCGAGLPFDQIAALARRGGSYPRTEILLNFNGDLGRRVASAAIRRANDSVLDSVCGSWWRDVVHATRDPDDEGTWGPVLGALVREYIRRLGQASGVRVMAIPVRRNLTGQPVFYLIHTTHSPHGSWEMSDAVARAGRDWTRKVQLIESGQTSLFDDDPDLLVDGHAEGMRQVRSNALQMIASGDERQLVDAVYTILNGAVGVVTASDIGTVLRALQKEGRLTMSNEKRLERRHLTAVTPHAG